MHHEATDQTHPTRSAPLCTACAHFLIDVYRDIGLCAHPATPRDVATGDAVMPIRDMRSQYINDSEIKGALRHCGPGAALFAPDQSAPKGAAKQATAHVLETGSNLPEPRSDAVPHHTGELVAGTGTHQRRDQLGMSGRVPRAKRRVD